MTNQLTVVTGASGAVGSALAQHLAQLGQRVAVIGRSSASLAPLASDRVTPIVLDEKSEQPWAQALATIERDLGTPTGAVLAAGGWAGGAKLYEPAADKHWSSMFTQNLETARLALAGLLPAMVRARAGSVVIVGSRAAVRPWEAAGAAAYAASKAALVALAQTAAAEVLESGVRINAVLPSTIDTSTNRKAMPQADSARWVSFASLCEVVTFLLSNGARDISGALLPVYGKA